MHFYLKLIKLTTILQFSFLLVSTTAINIHLPEFTDHRDTLYATKLLKSVSIFHIFSNIYLN